MQQPSNDNSLDAPRVATRECTVCGAPMFLAIIEPSHKDGHDRRIFECFICNHVETVEVKFC